MSKSCLFAPCHGKGEWRNCKLAGMQTIIRRSKEKGASLHLDLEKLVDSLGENATVQCHKSCYSSYTSVSRNQKTVGTSKRKASWGPESYRVLKSQVKVDFVFNRDCVLCGKVCVPKDPKHPDRWDPVKQCETKDRGKGVPTFMQVLYDICDQRQDSWGREVSLRLSGVHTDLPACDGQYHVRCYDRFRHIPINTVIVESCKPIVDEALKYVIDEMKVDMHVT